MNVTSSDYRVKPNICPNCGKTLDAATACEGDRKPAPGDFTVCIYCAIILRFDNDMNLREVTKEELAAFAIENTHEARLLIETILCIKQLRIKRIQNN